VTLRARLTATFLTVVLGPVLLGALFIGTTVSALAEERVRDRLDTAAGAVRAEIGARCQRLAAAASTAALLGHAQAIDNGLPMTVTLTDASGSVVSSAGPRSSAEWADCATTGSPPATAFGVRVERRDPTGTLVGYAQATMPVDEALTQVLARASAASVSPGPPRAGAHVYHLDPEPGQPLSLTLAVDPPAISGLYLVLLAVVVVAGMVAVAAAWWLARSTTRPLAELALATERVAAGDLGAQVPVRTDDEVGRLAATFNRMTREMRGYVRALTASRDQLRGYLALLGDTLSGTHDLSRILHVTLHTARAATSAQSGVVLLYDPTTRMLVAQCTVGPRDLGGLRLKLGEGLLGTVAESGETARSGARGGQPGVALAPGEPENTTFVAVPFAAPAVDSGEAAARGVLALYDRVGPDEFDDADLATLTTFASQAAIALDNVRLHEEAQRLSLTDSLTGLFNYRYLRESLRREVERASRFGRTLAIVALDLDHFKEVNDTYGHAAGDAVLAELAHRIQTITREVDFSFRCGGEEFVILLPETDAAGGAALARRLGAGIRGAPVVVGDAVIGVTVSIGVAVYPVNGATGAAVLEAADVALYAAKAGGRDTFRVASASTVPTRVAGASRATHPTRRARGG
jgi:two-component system, cell cycle response regulator